MFYGDIKSGDDLICFVCQVEFCTDFGDPNKARPWSKHSRQPEKTKDEQKPKEEKRLENKVKVEHLSKNIKKKIKKAAMQNLFC